MGTRMGSDVIIGQAIGRIKKKFPLPLSPSTFKKNNGGDAAQRQGRGKSPALLFCMNLRGRDAAGLQ